jgi:hypothetical protein
LRDKIVGQHLVQRAVHRGGADLAALSDVVDALHEEVAVRRSFGESKRNV